MTVPMPDRIPLDLPPASPEALEELIRKVAGAARCLAEVDDRLIGTGATAPGWLGDDAAAAATQIATVAALVRAASENALPVAGRLSSHADQLRVTLRQIDELRDEQDRQFQHAYRRLSALPDVQTQLTMGGSEVRAIVAAVEAGEASRRSRHAALLEDLANDAAATARVLTNACAAVGGHGPPGAPDDVIAYLAGQLPGWGDPELARRGRAAAADLGAAGPEEWNELARELAVFARLPAFAGALVTSLGESGVREVLGLMGKRTFGDDLQGRTSRLAGFFGTVLGAAAQDSSAAVGAVLSATYVDSRDESLDPDHIAVGMAVLLRASSSAGPAPMTVASWARQVLAREHALSGSAAGARAVDRIYPNARFDDVTDQDSFRRFDPVPVLVGWLADRGTAQSAAASLGESSAWTVLLGRQWDDAGTALADLVSLAAAHAGASGARAAWSGLDAIGRGLIEGDPALRTVDRETVAAVAPALGDLVAAHLPVATRLLEELGSGSLSDGSEAVAHGLGYLTVDPDAAAALAAALEDWAVVQPHEPTGTSAAFPLPAIAVPSSYVAVQQFGRRLAHALDESEAQERAGLRARMWTVATAPLVFIPGPVGIGIGVAAGYLAIALDMDGTWDAAPLPSSFDQAEAARMAATIARVPPGTTEMGLVVAGQARGAYERAIRQLGTPDTPRSPDADLAAPLEGALQGIAWGQITRGQPTLRRIGELVDSLVG